MPDCGGRIGDYLRVGKPVLKGCVLTQVRTAQEDAIMVMTDGFYDNFDHITKEVFPIYENSVTLIDFIEKLSKVLIDNTRHIRLMVEARRKYDEGKLDHSTVAIHRTSHTYVDIMTNYYSTTYNVLLPRPRSVSLGSRPSYFEPPLRHTASSARWEPRFHSLRLPSKSAEKKRHRMTIGTPNTIPRTTPCGKHVDLATTLTFTEEADGEIFTRNSSPQQPTAFQKHFEDYC